MERLSALEKAVLRAVASQLQDEASHLVAQLEHAHVISRRNTGAGFYTTLATDPTCPLVSAGSPVGNVSASLSGLKLGMGFLLWLRDGRIHELEGYSFQEDTSQLDLSPGNGNLVFEIVSDRRSKCRIPAPSHSGRTFPSTLWQHFLRSAGRIVKDGPQGRRLRRSLEERPLTTAGDR